jgi:hypothetical protein
MAPGAAVGGEGAVPDPPPAALRARRGLRQHGAHERLPGAALGAGVLDWRPDAASGDLFHGRASSSHHKVMARALQGPPLHPPAFPA